MSGTAATATTSTDTLRVPSSFTASLLLKPENRVKRAVSANAGRYTTPETGVDFPYGLRGGPVSDAA